MRNEWAAVHASSIAAIEAVNFDSWTMLNEEPLCRALDTWVVHRVMR